MPRPPAPERLVVRLLQESATPILGLDSRRQIVFVNRGLEDWLGIEAAQFVGRRCDYRASGDDPLAAACAGLCPPPEAFAGIATAGAVSRLATADRSFERRAARFLLCAGKEADEALLLVIVQAEDAASAAPNTIAVSPERLHAALLSLRSQLGKRFHISQLVGESEPIVRVREQIRVAAEAKTRVLIVGPPGSGREHVARTIHFAQSSAAIGPLVPIACSLVDAEQMQASLTSLLRRQYETPTDRPPAALLLDVDRLRPDAQQELAGFFQLPEVELHTLATSRTSLERLANKGKFRRDLAYQLSTFKIVLPSLARRARDIPLLAQHFLEEANRTEGRQLSGFHPAALEFLAGLPWPGNITELAQAVRAASVRATGTRVVVADLPAWTHLAGDAAKHGSGEEPAIVLDDFLAGIERELLARALKKSRGNKSKAAQLLGLTRQRLLRRLSQLGLIDAVAAEEPVVFEPLPDDS